MCTFATTDMKECQGILQCQDRTALLRFLSLLSLSLSPLSLPRGSRINCLKRLSHIIMDFSSVTSAEWKRSGNRMVKYKTVSAVKNRQLAESLHIYSPEVLLPQPLLRFVHEANGGELPFSAHNMCICSCCGMDNREKNAVNGRCTEYAIVLWGDRYMMGLKKGILFKREGKFWKGLERGMNKKGSMYRVGRNKNPPPPGVRSK